MISFLFMSLCFNNKDYPRRSWNTKSDDIDKHEHLCSSFLGEKVALLPDAAHSFGQTQKNLQFCGLIPGGSSRPKELIGTFHIGLFSSFVILYILGRWRRICISGLDPKLAMVIVHYVIGPEDSSISVWCVTLYIQVVGKQNKIKQKSLSRKTIKKHASMSILGYAGWVWRMLCAARWCTRGVWGLCECLFMSSENLSKGLCHCWHLSLQACTGWSLSVCIRKELRSHSHLSPIDSPN